MIEDDGHARGQGLLLYSQLMTARSLQEADLVLVVTDHSGVDYQLVADAARVVVDTRGVLLEVRGRARVVGLSGAQTGGAREMLATR